VDIIENVMLLLMVGTWSSRLELVLRNNSKVVQSNQCLSAAYITTFTLNTNIYTSTVNLTPALFS